jgi:tRNA(Ile)-lysidine synthase
LRGEESEADATFVAAAADALELPRSIEARDVRSLVQTEKGSLEEVARRERYAFFERVALSIGAEYVLLGHHADDNVETIVHRVLRGTGIRGLAGIPPGRSLRPGSGILLVRPLLTFRREELRRYLNEVGAAYRDDASNQVLDTTRNRIRHQLLPELAAEFNPQVCEAVLRLAEQARWIDQYIRATVEKSFEALVISRTDQELVLNAAALARKGRIVQTELLRTAIVAFGQGEQDLTFEHLKAVAGLLSEPKSGRQLVLPGGMTAQLVYNRLILAVPTDEPRETMAAAVAVHVPGRTTLPLRNLELECTVERVSETEVATHRHNRDRLEEWLDLDSVHLPLLERPRRPGDRFCPLGGPGSKKLSDFLGDEKVDPSARDKVAVLCDQLGPIWIVGYRIDERVKMTRLTRQALRVRARKLHD